MYWNSPHTPSLCTIIHVVVGHLSDLASVSVSCGFGLIKWSCYGWQISLQFIISCITSTILDCNGWFLMPINSGIRKNKTKTVHKFFSQNYHPIQQSFQIFKNVCGDVTITLPTFLALRVSRIHGIFLMYTENFFFEYWPIVYTIVLQIIFNQ